MQKARRLTPLVLPALIAFLAAFLAWFPLAPVWKSDDLIAVHYAMDGSRVLHDFVGNQYGLPPGLVWFYRPLVTASFWVEGVLAGHDPVTWCWISHVGNALAHATSCALVLLIVVRFCTLRVAFAAALAWAFVPGHAGSVSWAVGRVDAHTTVWILLATLAFLRWQAGASRTRMLALGAQVLALMTKEQALVIPGIVVVLAFCAAAPGARLRAALRGCVPFVIVEALYFAWRYLLFGRLLGGYEGGLPPLGELATGLVTFTGYGLSPLGTLAVPNAMLARVLFFAGLVPALLGFVHALRSGRGALVAACLVLYVGAALPAVQFWPHTSNLLNLRYFYVALIPLVVVVVQDLRFAAPLYVATAFVGLVAMRTHFEGMDHAAASPRLALATALAGSSDPVALLAPPRDPEGAIFYPNHLGLDRLGVPPFTARPVRLFALRPLARRERMTTLDGARPPLPSLVVGPDRVEDRPGYGASLAAPPTLPDLIVALDGPDHWTSQLYWDIFKKRTNPAFAMRGVRAPWYRITVFTGGGYVCALCADEAPALSLDGRVAFGAWLQSKTAEGSVDAFVVKDLVQPTVLDLDLRLPVWIEAGTRDAADGGVFRPTHAARELLWITLDRDYAEWAAGRVFPRD